MSRSQGLSNKEIGEALDISVKVVEKHITKALSALRSGLKDNADIDYPLVVALLLLLLHA